MLWLMENPDPAEGVGSLKTWSFEGAHPKHERLGLKN